MFDRRTNARIGFVTTLLVFPFRLYRWLRARDEDASASDATVPRELLVGFAMHVAYSWAYDRDVWQLRSKRWRRGLLAALTVVLFWQVGTRTDSDFEAFSVGTGLATLVYRFWYGVLRPLPGPDN